MVGVYFENFETSAFIILAALIMLFNVIKICKKKKTTALTIFPFDNSRRRFCSPLFLDKTICWNIMRPVQPLCWTLSNGPLQRQNLCKRLVHHRQLWQSRMSEGHAIQMLSKTDITNKTANKTATTTRNEKTKKLMICFGCGKTIETTKA